ncbi:hypothetical protein CGCA056_v001487 [Colletotrichum aenigma]|uniref:uncharacterized protein n=1 Tax=Colletotrichum aenigma TaxID=1215731 RepID=UPI00187293B7|nr:uncharacterized protein CGCA056_v001487 [Colletotrichum aenigma]KAF5526853.1 hypothetical protein CGCA056_v001487 [Colletotrichum aenigma]
MESHLCTVSKDTHGFGRLHVHVSVGGNTSRCMFLVHSYPPTTTTTITTLLVASFSKHTHTHTHTHTSYPVQACAAVEVAAWGRVWDDCHPPPSLTPLIEAKHVCVLSWHVSYRNTGRSRCWLWESDGEGKGID